MFNFDAKFKEYIDVFNDYLSHNIEKFDSKFPTILSQSMKYAVVDGGKRVRPVLALATADALGVNREEILPFAFAIELIHSYSLVHDDLPAMDNDDYRRGKLSTHKKFGEAYGILAGDGLLNYAFEVCLGKESFNKNDLCATRLIAEYAGASGMIAGQVLDLQNEKNKDASEKILYEVYENKTAKLLTAPVLVASLLANGEKYDDLKEYAMNLGFTFQIVDDVMDETGDFSTIGKTPHKDKEVDKLTSIKVFGLSGAREKATFHYHKCVDALKNVKNNEFLLAFAEKMYLRNK